MKAATELGESLLAVARVAPTESNPLVRAIVGGTLSREALRAYITRLASMALAFPRRIAAVLSVCDDPAVRRCLIANLLEEEGVVAFEPAHGVTVVEAKRHGVMAMKLARAAGAVDGDVEPNAPAAPWFQERLAAGDWIGAFAYFAVGFEANVPSTFRLLVEPLVAHYGFDTGDLEFLTEHFIADERHGTESADLIAHAARTPEARENALNGARRGGKAWWALHRSAAFDPITR